MQSSKEQQGEIRKPSSVINVKKYRRIIEWERLEFFSRKLEIPRNISCKDGHNKEQKWYGPNKQKILRSGTKEHTEELYKKKILMTQITTMV